MRVLPAPAGLQALAPLAPPIIGRVSCLSGQKEREKKRKFGPMAHELGWLVYEWNRFQEALAELFSDMLGVRQNMPFAIWYSTTNERAQREMLRAAVEQKYPPVPSSDPHRETLLWLTNQAAKLADQRNDAIHAPIVFVQASDQIELLPMYLFGNPRATKLKNKDLLKEFRWYREHASTLADFAEKIHWALIFPADFAWPDRPPLPRLDQSPSRKPQRPRKRAK
jgi:hypothetical protein